MNIRSAHEAEIDQPAGPFSLEVWRYEKALARPADGSHGGSA